ncbi:hypothetical protein Val02_85240 [Virgisporangium aliadipatigenens]|uniref:DUF4184 family protein n=1 Tax=Virgisporangium aliadipatigenens TaxID=741659 RepID=A0A8J3YY03_9ACTN|nr:DUF4184 family protein [Virgisporangium aliadipatigenens]GIJ51638.1 hypothetical protein Val02_85240 [Virgisporangium aliadipatigenens]
MPLTFPSHQAAVLPLKLRWPHRFDGVALYVGAAAPDLIYPFDGIPWTIRTHTVASLFWWSLPVTFVVAALLRRAAPAVAAHLPISPDWAVIRHSGHPWWVTAYSAVLGAATHLFWDFLTHTDGWLNAILGFDWYERMPLAWYYVSDLPSSALGGLAVVAGFVHIGRSRLLVRWHGEPPALPPREPRRFWTAFAIVAVPVWIATPLLPHHNNYGALGTRIIAAIVLGLTAGAVAVAVKQRQYEDHGVSGRTRHHG